MNTFYCFIRNPSLDGSGDVAGSCVGGDVADSCVGGVVAGSCVGGVVAGRCVGEVVRDVTGSGNITVIGISAVTGSNS